MKAVKPTTKQLINRTALAILAAYALTTIHHIYGGLLLEPRTGCASPASWRFRH